MRLRHGLQLAYCTNIHRGETWAEILAALQMHTLAVRDRVASGQPYAIGLRLGDAAARELSDPAILTGFRRWLDRNQSYVFTINGFPYGRFHGTRVKEQVYAPDWTTPERLEYTMRLFGILAELVPPGGEGSVSTVPCSFKAFIQSPAQEVQMRQTLWRCVEQLEALSVKTGRDLHLGLEPEPLCHLETSTEVVDFLGRMRADRPGDDRLARRLGVNYDACHLAIEFEEPSAALARFKSAGVRISKLHFSSALKVRPTTAARRALADFADPTYLHQVIERGPGGILTRMMDLNLALERAEGWGDAEASEREWRVHFHIPLHAQPEPPFESTADHLLGVMDGLAAEPGLCRHVEMETYTWEVMPGPLREGAVVDQLAAEYAWTLGHLRARGLA